MKYLTALWQALMAFFSHLKEHDRTERKEEQAKEQAQRTTSARERHDEEIRNTSSADVDSRLDKWMRD